MLAACVRAAWRTVGLLDVVDDRVGLGSVVDVDATSEAVLEVNHRDARRHVGRRRVEREEVLFRERHLRGEVTGVTSGFDARHSRV